MAMKVGGRSRLTSEINVTPLVDVVLVLLIVFLVVTPLLQQGKDVSLPHARQADQESAAEPLVLSVTNDGRLWLGTDELDSIAATERRLVEELKQSPDRAILLKGDERLQVGQVRAVMRAARRAGARGVSLAVAEPTSDASAE